MTIVQAEKICGYRIERLTNIGEKLVAFAAFDDEAKLLAKAESTKGEKVCLNMIIGKLYNIEGDRIYAEQGHRCLDCGKPLTRSGMQRHHVAPRARGRHDRGNLAGLCGPCHGKRHLKTNL